MNGRQLSDFLQGTSHNTPFIAFAWSYIDDLR